MVSEHDSRTLSSAPHDSVHDSEITINKGTTPIRGSEPRVKKISLTTHGAPDEPTNIVGCIEISRGYKVR